MTNPSPIGLDGVVVHEECLLPGTKGLGSALACLNTARYGIIWGVTGAASDCLSQTLEYTKARHQFGRPIASFQLVQQKLADAAKIIGTEPATLQLRYLQTLTEIATEKNSTVIFPIPIDFLSIFMKK